MKSARPAYTLHSTATRSQPSNVCTRRASERRPQTLEMQAPCKCRGTQSHGGLTTETGGSRTGPAGPQGSVQGAEMVSERGELV